MKNKTNSNFVMHVYECLFCVATNNLCIIGCCNMFVALYLLLISRRPFVDHLLKPKDCQTDGLC